MAGEAAAKIERAAIDALLVALVRQAGGEVRVTRAELNAIYPGDRLLQAWDEATDAILLKDAPAPQGNGRGTRSSMWG